MHLLGIEEEGALKATMMWCTSEGKGRNDGMSCRLIKYWNWDQKKYLLISYQIWYESWIMKEDNDLDGQEVSEMWEE